MPRAYLPAVMKPVFVTRRNALRAALSFGAAAAFVHREAGACEAFASTLRVIHPWTRATRQGVTSTSVFMVIDEVQQDDRLVGVTMAIAGGAELVGDGVGPAVDLFIPKGSEIVFADPGTHLRLLGLDRQLLLGRSFPLQLRFEKGGLVYTTLNVDQLPLSANSIP